MGKDLQKNNKGLIVFLLFLLIFTLGYYFLSTKTNKSFIENGPSDLTLTEISDSNKGPNIVNNDTVETETASNVATSTPVIEEYKVFVGEDWKSVNLCKINHKALPAMKGIYGNAENYSLDMKSCYFGYNFDDISGNTTPVTLSIDVYYDYSGESRRNFYFSKNDDANSDKTSKYLGGKEFILNGEKWLMLEWADAFTDDDNYSPKVVYLKAQGNSLVAIKGSGQYGYMAFDDTVRKFLSSIELK
jgi:hypothetical protein